MQYFVRHKISGEEKILQADQVNDMEHNEKGDIIVFDVDMEPHYLLDEHGEITKYSDVTSG